MGLAEFADEVKHRRGRLSQANLAILAGVSKSLIERLEAKRGDAPMIGRNQAIDLAAALGWDITEALALIDEGPLSDWERAELDSDTVRRAKLDRLWPHLAARQQHALVELIASMITEDAPPTEPPHHSRDRQVHKIKPGSGEIPKLPGPREQGPSGDL